jgi:ribosomal protein S3
MSKKLESISETEKIILKEIAYYFKSDSHKLGIKRLIFEDNTIHILLFRPGLLIGRKGEDINNLSEILKKKLNNQDLKLHIEESLIDDYLIDYSDLDLDYL